MMIFRVISRQQIPTAGLLEDLGMRTTVVLSREGIEEPGTKTVLVILKYPDNVGFFNRALIIEDDCEWDGDLVEGHEPYLILYDKYKRPLNQNQ